MQEEKKHPSILIVDDDMALLQALPQVVHLRMQDNDVETSEDAHQALAKIREYDYEVVISDVKMPGMDGLDLLQKIHEIRPDTPVILITGHGDHELAIRALRGGAYDYILKPIDRDIFVAALQRAIQTRQLRRKVTEQQLALALHAKSLERLVEKRTSELVTANATKDKFLHIVSQEITIPLSNLQSMVQLARRRLDQHDPAAELEQVLLDMERSIERTEVFTRDLLDTSQIETNMFVLKRQRIDLVALCRETLDEYTAGAGPTLQCELSGESIKVDVDPDRFKQVIINLLSNARKFSPRGSPITVTLWQSGYEVAFSVQDTGVGIPDEALPHIFEQFYRAPGVSIQTGRKAGLGLGLYITHKIVERHGGHIEVQSAQGEGSTFTVVLPLAIDSDLDTQQTTQQATRPQAIWTIIH